MSRVLSSSAKFRAVFALPFLVALLAASRARCQTLNWGSLAGSQIVDSGGAPLSESFLIQLGAFDVDFEPAEANVAGWSEHWHVFDTAAYSYDPQDGAYFTGTAELQDMPDYPAIFQGLTAYIWIRNATSTEFFLASATAKQETAAWIFPAAATDCCGNGPVTSWSVSDLGDDTPVWGGQLGHAGAGSFDASGGPYDIQTHAVPESAPAALFALACSFGFLRRRRA